MECAASMAVPKTESTSAAPDSPRVSRTVRLGGALWIVGAIQFVVAMIVVQLAWTTPYNILTNAVSDLGAVSCHENPMGTSYVCSPLHVVFNGSIIAFGIVVAVGAIAVFPLFSRNRAALAGTILLIVAGGGAAIVGIFPEDTVGAAHGLGALLAFGGSAAALLFLGLSMTGHPRWIGYRLFTLVCGAFSGGVLVASVFREEYGPVGFGGLERLIVAPALLWLGVVGTQIVRERILLPRTRPT